MPESMTSDEIREKFLSFFERKGHLRVASSSLIPVGDPTLLLTIAGMNQFKPYFSGQQQPPQNRLTSSQKCFRTPDIDIVGDATHNTMFEMLGNFSIGDYFKDQAIEFAMEFVSQELNLPKEQFGITIHHTDDEAFEIWKNIGILEENIYRFGDEDNWWGPPIHGSEGPCGPCSELHYDFGRDKGCLKDNCGPNCDNKTATSEPCDRFVELWNLVFMQFYHYPEGHRDNLPAPSIDTGMGLERATIIMQNARTMYETDLFAPLINKVISLTPEQYGQNTETDYAIRAVAEHSRSSTFLTADGVVPSNEGRGYVLRRVIRRAIRLGKKLGMEDNFMSDMSEIVITKMSSIYPELANNKEFIMTVLKLEEERFQQAYVNGYAMLEEALTTESTLTGKTIFQLWDTYGFPVEVTNEIAIEKNIPVDMIGFESEMEKQRERARSKSQFGDDHARINLYRDLGIVSTKFTGYENLTGNSVVVGLISGSTNISSADVGDDIEVILRETPFYSEGGGQVGDSGKLSNNELTVNIYDTKEAIPGVTVHFGKISKGTIKLGESVDAIVDKEKRLDAARNHTATHMLHAALREVLGAHVRQAGSLVAPDRLRFDFSHVKPLTIKELWEVQHLVNEKIRANAQVSHAEDTYANAIKQGALAFFGDKYGETVRTIEISNGKKFSLEVCGGTHVHQTGEIGNVTIIGESSIGAGMRRIEAVTGRASELLAWEKSNRETKLADLLQTSTPELETKISTLLNDIEDINTKYQNAQHRLSLQSAESSLKKSKTVNGINVISDMTQAINMDILRASGDWIKEKIDSGIVVLGAVIDEKPMIAVTVTLDLVEMGLDASLIAKKASTLMGGGGGGRPESAQGGGRNPNKLPEVLSEIPNIIAAITNDRKS